jgi:hypothetical protein
MIGDRAVPLPQPTWTWLRARLPWWIAIAALFTAVLVLLSLRVGRLQQYTQGDDMMYFLDGLDRLEQLRANGLNGIVVGYLHQPPHSPWSSFLAASSFAIRVARVGTLMTCTAPFAAQGVMQCRPDFAARIVHGDRVRFTGSMMCSRETLPRVGRCGSREDLGVNDLAKDLEPDDNPRTGAIEIGRPIERSGPMRSGSRGIPRAPTRRSPRRAAPAVAPSGLPRRVGPATPWRRRAGARERARPPSRQPRSAFRAPARASQRERPRRSRRPPA